MGSIAKKPLTASKILNDGLEHSCCLNDQTYTHSQLSIVSLVSEPETYDDNSSMTQYIDHVTAASGAAAGDRALSVVRSAARLSGR